MATKTITEFNKTQIKKTMQTYAHFSKNPYIEIFAKIEGVSISLYTSNKLVFQGNNLEHVIKTYFPSIENELVEEKRVENKISQLNTGTDEVGCGDIFGPIVSCSCTIENNEQINYLTQLGIKDSKKLSDEKIVKIASQIRKDSLIKYSINILSNQFINSTNLNLNELKTLSHIKCITQLDN